MLFSHVIELRSTTRSRSRFRCLYIIYGLDINAGIEEARTQNDIYIYLLEQDRLRFQKHQSIQTKDEAGLHNQSCGVRARNGTDFQ